MDKALQKTDEMGTASLPKLIAKYSVVTFCALFFNELYNIIDTLFVSRGVGDNAMGGVSIIFPFMMIQGAISQTIGSGAATVVSKLLGKREYEKAGSVTACAMLTFYITSILITILGLILLTPLLRLFGATDDIMPYAKEYFTIILLGNVFSTGFSSIIRAEGKMVYSLLIWLIPTAVNISLDAVFIYALDMGVKGAALATVICYFTSFLMSVIFFKKISVQKFSKIKIEPKMIWEIITLGAPMLLQLGSMSILFMIINKALSASGGTLSINTFAYVSKILSFAIVPFNAIATAISPIISYNQGAGKLKRINKTFNTSIIMCEIYSAIGIIMAFTMSNLCIKIFTSDTDIVNQGAAALKILSLAMPTAPLTIITGIYFQALGKKSQAILTNSLIVLLSLAAIIIFMKTAYTNGIYIAISIACLIAGAAAAILKKQTKL